MTTLPAGYRAFMLRVWRAPEAPWQASLEDPHTGERRAFATLAQLVAFLEGAAGDAGSGAPTAGRVPEAPRSSASPAEH